MVVGTSSSAIFFTHAVATLLFALAAPQPDAREGPQGTPAAGWTGCATRRTEGGEADNDVTSAVEMVEERNGNGPLKTTRRRDPTR